jgi:DNA-nicking Smr family endonuclease
MPGDKPRNPRAGSKLGPEDRALWKKVTRDATPLDPSLRKPADEVSTAPAKSEPNRPGAPAKASAPNLAPRILRPTAKTTPSRISIDLAGGSPTPVGRPQAGLDRRNAERLRRGEREPDGRIDLHGMTAERAHRALDSRIAAALGRGERLVLVITGKGGKTRSEDDAPFMRDGQGVLRQQAPNWLRSGPHAASIVGIYQAHQRHGGAGAFYVYLKKRR